MVKWSLENLLGKRRRTEEKVSVMLKSSFFQIFPVFPSNPGTFRRYSRWSYMSTVAGWLRRVHLPHRERSRHALHLPRADWFQEEKSLKRERHSVFFHSREPDVRQSRSGRRSIRSGQTQNYGVQKFLEGSPKYSILMLAQRKGLQFYQTRSHAIALFNTLPGICIEQVVHMKTVEDLYCKVHQSPRLPRVVPTPKFAACTSGSF